MYQKNMRVAWFIVLSLLLVVMAACGQTTEGEREADDVNDEQAETEETDEGQEVEDEKEAITVGINQLVEHPSLDASREGFIESFLENGYTEGETVIFDIQNAQGDQGTATSIANKFVTDGVDLILAIATPAAQATAQAVDEIPVLFTAVTEPQEAGLVDSWEEPGKNVTGTSDLNPVEGQISLIPKIAPDAKTIGIVYSSGEVNSQVQVDHAQEAAEKMDLELELVAISNKSEVLQAAESLVGKVDALYVPTDNAVVDALESMIQIAEQEQLPLIVGEGDSVERGGLATLGIDYHLLGYQTGEMAMRILDGEDPATMPVETQEVVKLIVNIGAAERMGVELPEDLIDEADEVVE